MAAKFIELKAAAQQLGITTEQLQELRESGKIHGYKDGASWKFKSEEVERLGKEMSASAAPADDDLDFDDSGSLSGEEFDHLLGVDPGSDSDDNLEDSSILISSDAAKDEDLESSSTVIGREKESDLRLADGDDDSAIKPAGSSAKKVPSDDLKLAESEDLSDELSLADDLEFESDEALALGIDSDLSESSGSDQDVLDDSDASAVAVDAGDSGIGLANPSDSGLSLEGGSSAAALELPEDEEMISLEDDVMSASDEGKLLQQDEEFLLSPSDEMAGDESSDSGSQVIALDESGAFDSDADLVAAEGAEPVLVPDEVEGLDMQLEPIDQAAAVARATPAAGAVALETDYTVWNLLSLVFVVLLLGVTGMLVADVVRNMWSWNSETGVASGLANAIIDALGMK